MLEYILYYLFIYIIASYIRLRLKSNEKEYFWNCFTRVVSLTNAISCIYNVYYITSDYINLKYVGTNYFVDNLFRFSAYLFVDGLFILFYTRKINTDFLTSIAHHFVGGFGIYLIAHQRLGLGLGAYFAGTEISTPFLSLSWLLYTNKINNWFTYAVFGLLYLVFTISRIFTIPLLCYYIWYNTVDIFGLNITEFIMVYFGSGVLMLLNITWYILLTKKATGFIC